MNFVIAPKEIELLTGMNFFAGFGYVLFWASLVENENL